MLQRNLRALSVTTTESRENKKSIKTFSFQRVSNRKNVIHNTDLVMKKK